MRLAIVGTRKKEKKLIIKKWWHVCNNAARFVTRWLNVVR